MLVFSSPRIDVACSGSHWIRVLAIAAIVSCSSALDTFGMPGTYYGLIMVDDNLPFEPP